MKLVSASGTGRRCAGRIRAAAIEPFESKTDRLITVLRRMGFLEQVGARGRVNGAIVVQGWIHLRGATAAKPPWRETANRLLSELLERITALNRNPHFLARV